MASIERTAYPQFPRLMSARELHVFYTPSDEEIEWAETATDSDGSLLGMVLALKCFQRMGRFPKQDEVPEVVIDHVRRCLDLGPDVSPAYGSDRTQRHHRGLIRKRVGVIYNPKKAREVAAAAIREAAAVKNNPPDLINVALEMLVAQSLELLGFTVLDKMATTIRAQVNREIIAGIYGRISPGERVGLLATLQVRGDDWQGIVKLTPKMINGDPLTARGQGFQLTRALHLVVAQTKLITIMVNLTMPSQPPITKLTVPVELGQGGTVNLLKLSGGTGMVGSGGSVCVACVRPLWPCR